MPIYTGQGVGAPRDVSCPSVDFCVAVSTGGVYFQRDGSWSAGERVGSYLVAISCVSKTFCIATGASPRGVLRYDGSTWSNQSVPGDAYLSSVSCTSRTFCVGATGAGTVYTYDGQVWSGPQQVAKPADYDVSCSSAQFCVMMSTRGVFAVFDGTTWSPQAQITAHPVSGLSCPVDGMCMAVTTNNHAFMYSAGDWTRSRILDPHDGYFYDVSCSTSTFCTAVDHANAVTYRGRRG